MFGIPNYTDLLQTQSLLRDFDIPKMQLYTLPIVGDNAPNQQKRIYFQNYDGIVGKTIVGMQINCNSSDMFTSYDDSGVAINIPSLNQYFGFTLSLFDIRTQAYKINRLPLGLLRSQTTGTNFKLPYFLIDVMPDFEQSFITFNGPASLFVTSPYYLFFTIFYND